MVVSTIGRLQKNTYNKINKPHQVAGYLKKPISIQLTTQVVNLTKTI